MSKFNEVIDNVKKDVENNFKEAQDVYEKNVNRIERFPLWSTFIIGVLLTLVYIIFNLLEDLKEKLFGWDILLQIPLIIGITFIANSITSFLKERYAKHKYTKLFENTKKDIIDKIISIKKDVAIEWVGDIPYDDLQSIINSGLKRIHNNPVTIYPILNEYLKENNEKNMYIICYDGLENLRALFPKNRMCEFLNNGLNLYVISANPFHFYWIQHKIDMQISLDEIRPHDVEPLVDINENKIKELDKYWIKEINNIQGGGKGNKISIKYHNSLPSVYCIILDDRLFLSGKMIGDSKISDPPIFEYIKNSNEESIYKKYSEYFNLLWDDEELSSKDMEIKLTPKLLINNEIVNKILQNTCSAMTDILRTINKDSKILIPNADCIRAFLTIVDYGEPITVNDGNGEKKVMRRYNTNAVNRSNTISPYECNNSIDKRGYPIIESHAIGSTILTGKEYFRIIDLDKEPQDVENFNACASLVLPIMGQNDRVINYIKHWDYKKDDAHYINDISKTIKPNTIESRNSKIIATITFEFGNDLKSHIVSIPHEECKYENDLIDFNEKHGNVFKIELINGEIKPITSELSTIRLKEEAKRCKELICKYLGIGIN
jgi:hypothetical protein